MAKISAYDNLDTINGSVFYGNLIEATSNRIVASDGYQTSVYEGYGFRYNGDFIVGGTLTGYSGYLDNQLVVTVSELQIPAPSVQYLIENNDLPGLFGIALSGDDHIFGSAYSDRLAGYGGNDYIVGGGGDDYLEGGYGNDTFVLGIGAGVAVGGEGLDRLALPDSGSDYTYNSVGESFAFYHRDKAIDVLIDGVERVDFNNGTLAFDLDGNAGQAYRLYQAVFDRAPDENGLGYWIDELDVGKGDLAWVAGNFMLSDEFTDTYGTPESVSNAEFLNLIYDNVLDRNPDSKGFNYWMDELDSGFSREHLVASFSESNENKANVADAISEGIWYI